MTVTVGVRLDEDEIVMMDELAGLFGMDRSGWLRDVICDAVARQTHRTRVLRELATKYAGGPPDPVNGALTPTQGAIWNLLRTHPAGLCRRDLARWDFWEVSNRISEIEDRLGIVVRRERCVDHPHRHRVIRYSL